MKRIIPLLLTAFLLISCADTSTPDSALRTALNEEQELLNIASLFDGYLQEDKTIKVYVSDMGNESFELIRYLLPVLRNANALDLGFWFLSGLDDGQIKTYLEGGNDALTELEILRKTDPLSCGFDEYKTLLVDIKNFYQNLSETESMRISNGSDVRIEFVLQGTDSVDDQNRVGILVHTPIRRKNGWEIPFDGQLYYMMYHDWPLKRYSAFQLSESPLADSFVTRDSENAGITASAEFDAIVLMGLPDSSFDFTPSTDFITEENVDEVLDFFPGQIIREKVKPAAYLINKKIGKIHRIRTRRLQKTYDLIDELETVGRQ